METHKFRMTKTRGMELTRRDALAALAAGGAAVGVGAALRASDGGDAGPEAREVATPEAPGSNEATGATPGPPETPTNIDDHEWDTLFAVADLVYPSAVGGVEPFVRTYVEGVASERPAYTSGASAAIARLDGMGREWHGGRFVDLDPGTREQLLRETGADTAEPDPEGSPAERIRYYLVNELLYALYTSPTGGELVGIENPQGHPGGATSYRRGPQG
jgi:hypothetical protein